MSVILYSDKGVYMLKECSKHGVTEHSSVGIVKPRLKCKKCTNEYSAKYNKGLKGKCVEYKGGSCVKCGYNRCLSALQFHNLNPDEKDFTIGDRAYGRKIVKKWSVVKQELDKCILVCANCHCEIHADRVDVTKSD